VWGYHAVNLAIHLAAACLVWVLIRDTLARGRQVAQRYRSAAAGLALAASLLWVAHPLQTQAVTYISQRFEALMGLFYVLTFYCLLRGHASPRPARWYAASIAACALGMGTKEVMFTAPLMALWYDRVFWSVSWQELLQRRGWYYLLLGATMAIPLLLLWDHAPHLPSAGVLIVDSVSPREYALSQPGVILHYLRLCAWPAGQCLDYGWPIARGAAQIVAPLLLLGGAALGLAWCVFFRPAWGFVGAWCFVILAPTSSVAPIVDLAFEHRMYLSLAAVTLAAAIGGYELTARLRQPRVRMLLRGGVLAMVVAALAVTSAVRNRVYATPISLWSDVVAKAPHHWRGHKNLAAELQTAGRTAEAEGEYRAALRLRPALPDARVCLAEILMGRGDFPAAEAELREALRWNPASAEAHEKLGVALAGQQDLAAAVEEFEQSLALSPTAPRVHANLAVALKKLGRLREAIEHYRTALRLRDDWPQVENDLAWLLATSDVADSHGAQEAVSLAQRACQATGGQYQCLDTLAAAYAATRRFDRALAHADTAHRQALQAGRTREAELIAARIETYRAGRPYRAAAY